ncbi:hypothetical protein GCM10025868_00770 [Angustibacter aerolatus]|uniref:EamA domain-containing protein n=1 Tax=Angustibacter aerolatus TaxID=1162965 RepID=A0ABQ6JD54_9ACTN|nr:hypothetical protein GCM10025868_00770 [Angustibacter aerolatus]
MAKQVTDVAPVLVVLGLRYAVAAVALVTVCIATRQQRPGRRQAAVAVGLGVTQAAVLLLETYGVARTSATNAGLLISLTVVLTPVVDGLWARSWLPPRYFVAAVLAVVGVALLVSGDGVHAPAGATGWCWRQPACGRGT